MKGKVQTVVGAVNPNDLGLVLPHEHFEIGIEAAFSSEPLSRPELKNAEFNLKNLGWIRQFPYSHVPNMNVRGEEVRVALKEDLKQFKSCGGGTVVDNTTVGIKYPDRNKFIKKLSEETEVHVIAGAGFYVTSSQSTDTLTMPEEKMAALMTKDIVEGCEDESSVKCGIIGEIGCSWPLTDFEKKSLCASGEVESNLGCPVMIHPGRNIAAPEEIIRVFAEAGGNPKRVVMAHLDRTLLAKENLLEFASMGTFLEFDLFGIETSFYQQAPKVAMPSDSQRIDKIEALLQEGYEDRILLSHDIHTRHRLGNYGGHGFTHIPTVIVPMMLNRGITQQTINKMTVHNPANWLTFSK